MSKNAQHPPDNDLVTMIQTGSPEEADSAVRTLVKRHRRLILKQGFAYRLPESVSLAAGANAIWDAARRFDLSKGARFVTYMVFWLRKQVQMMVSSGSSGNVLMSSLASSEEGAPSFESGLECRSTSNGGMSGVARSDLAADLTVAMSEVEDEIRSVLECVALGKRTAKIAKELSLSRYAVANRREAGLRILRRKMKGYS